MKEGSSTSAFDAWAVGVGRGQLIQKGPVEDGGRTGSGEQAIVDALCCYTCQRLSPEGCSGSSRLGSARPQSGTALLLGALCQPPARLCGQLLPWGLAWGFVPVHDG